MSNGVIRLKYFDKSKKKLNNKGSALLTVLLFIAFLTILATTLLYITGMNFIIKQADYGNKRNFYKGETALEKVKAELTAKVVSEAAKEAYAQACMNYVSAATDDDGTTEGNREANYNRYFAEGVQKYLQEEFTTTCGAGSYNWEKYFTAYISDSDVTVKFEDPAVALETGTSLPADQTGDPDDSTDDGTLLIDTTNGIVTIKGVTVTYINDDTRLATIISTDFELHAPQIDWGVIRSAGEIDPALDVAEVSTLRQKNDVDITRCVKYTNWVKQ